MATTKSSGAARAPTAKQITEPTLDACRAADIDCLSEEVLALNALVTWCSAARTVIEKMQEWADADAEFAEALEEREVRIAAASWTRSQAVDGMALLLTHQCLLVEQMRDTAKEMVHG